MNQHIADLKHQIERILRWEPAEYWRLRDFEGLSNQIMAHTNQWVEAHDLQQFWRSSAHATPALLDALARFADYADWDDFCARNQVGEMIPTQPDFFHAPLWAITARWMVWILWLSVLASALVGVLQVWMLSYSKSDEYGMKYRVWEPINCTMK